MPHKRTGSAQLETPAKAAIQRPKSMFAKLSPGSLAKTSGHSSVDGPEIPTKSPRRRNKRFSLSLRPSAAEEPPRTPQMQDDDSFWRSPLRSPSLKRQGSLQTRRYNYEGKNEVQLPTSPRRSIYSQTTPSRSSVLLNSPQLSTKPLFLDKRAPSHLSSPSLNTSSPQLLQSPQLETQTSVWISEDRPEQSKRSSFVGRSTSMRLSKNDQHSRHKKTSSHGGGLKVSQIGAPHLMETTNQVAVNSALPISAAKNARKSMEISIMVTPSEQQTPKSTKKSLGTAKTGPIIKPVARTSTPLSSAPHSPVASRSQTKLTATPKSKASKTETKSQTTTPSKGISLIKRFFKLDKSKPDTHTPPRTHVSTPVVTPVSIPPTVPAAAAPSAVDRQRKYRSATAAPVRPSRQPDLDLLRHPSQISLQSSNESANSAGTHGTELTTPVAGKGHSPRIYGDHEWDYSIYHRHSMVEEKRQDRAVAEWI